MQNPGLITSALTVVFFTCIWVVFPSMNDVLLSQLIGPAKSTVISMSSMGEEQAIRLKTALSFGALPLLSWGVFTLIRRIKNLEYPTRKLWMIVSIIFIGYLIGFCMKFILLLMYMIDMEAYRLSPEIGNSISVSKIYFYDYALIFALVVGLLIFLFAKRKASDSDFPNTL